MLAPNPGSMKPFVVEPLAVVRVWGGRRLAAWGRCVEGADPIGESWEVHGSQPVRGANCSLDELCRRHGAELLGQWCRQPQAGFPLLTKWLDCQDWLSIQVHHDDSVASQLEGPGHRGKAEAWYFAEVQSQAEVIHGWKHGCPSEDQLADLTASSWSDLVHRYHPDPQSWSYTAPGTVHALGPGLLVFEVQQSSDLTYRLYDWGRMGLDGQPRPLHSSQGIRAICDSLPEAAVTTPDDLLGKIEILCPHFVIESVVGDREWSPCGRSVELLTALQTPATLDYLGESWTLGVGDSLVLPAQLSDVQMRSSGPWLRVRLAPL